MTYLTCREANSCVKKFKRGEDWVVAVYNHERLYWDESSPMDYWKATGYARNARDEMVARYCKPTHGEPATGAEKLSARILMTQIGYDAGEISLELERITTKRGIHDLIEKLNKLIKQRQK